MLLSVFEFFSFRCVAAAIFFAKKAKPLESRTFAVEGHFFPRELARRIFLFQNQPTPPLPAPSEIMVRLAALLGLAGKKLVTRQPV